MTKPDLDHAKEGDRKWAFAGGCWREWIPRGPGGDWIPSAPPPATARFFNYRSWVLDHVAGLRAAKAPQLQHEDPAVGPPLLLEMLECRRKD